MTTNLLPISSDGGFVTAGNITTASYASPAPTISGFSTVSAENIRLINGNITGGVATIVDDGINSIALALGAQMDVYGFPFSQTTRGQLTISGVATPSEVNGTWYYQSVNTNAYQIYTDSTYATLVDATGWSAYTGGGTVAIVKQVPAANIVINTNGYLTEFDNTGNLVLPAQGSITSPAGNLTIKASGETGDNPAVANSVIIQGGNTGTGDGGHIVLVSGVAPGAGGHAGNINITASNGQSLDGAINLTTAGGDWVFDGNGVVTLPGEGVIQSLNDTVILQSKDTGTGNINSVYLGTSGGLGFQESGVGNWLEIFRSGVDPDLATTNNLLIRTDSANTSPTWTFSKTGNLTLPANTFAINYANGTQVSLSGGNVSNISNGNSNVNIATANGNVTIAAVGNTTMTVTGTGANITGTANISGNVSLANVVLSSNAGQIAFNTAAYISGNANSLNRDGSILLQPYTGAGSNFAGVIVGGSGRLLSPGGSVHQIFNASDVTFQVAVKNITGLAATSTTSGALQITGGGGFTTNVYVGGSLVRTGAVTQTAWTTNGVGLKLPTAVYTDNSTAAGTQASSYVHLVDAPTLSFSNAVTVTNAATMYVAAPTAGTNATITTSYAMIANGSTQILGTATTGVNSILAGPSFTPLANTVAGFNSNVNSYTQITLQNKSTGADATTDYVLTADNGSDTVNYGDFGIINSGYDSNTPTNSLGNIVFAADTYMYAQGNTSNASQSGGNLAIGTTVPGKNVKIFAGGVTNASIVANIGNTGVTVTGAISANGNITTTSGTFVGNGAGLTNVTVNAAGNIQGTSSNVSLIAGSYTYTFDNAGTLTMPAAGGNEGAEIDFTKAPNSSLSGNAVVVDQYVDRLRIFEGGGTNRGVYIDLTQAAATVGTLLNNRVSGLVNAGTFVTMDLIKATVTTSGNRGLSLATTTGTFACNIAGNYATSTPSSGGASGTLTVTTTASASVFNWGFFNQGDLATYVLTDTTNSRAYRITVQIGNGYNSNMITIERLI